MKIFERLIEERMKVGISMAEMGRLLNIDRKSIWNYESGHRRVPYHIVEGYADKLGFELKIMLK